MAIALVCAKNAFATGIERYARSLERELQAMGREVELVYLRRRELRLFGRPVGGLASVWLARAAARRGGHEIVHAVDPAVATRHADVVTVHDLLVESAPEHHPASVGARLDWAMTRRAARRVPWIVSDSEVTRQEILARWRVDPARVTTVHLGIDHEAFRPSDRPAPHLAPDRPNLVYVGDDHPRKNVGLAVRALAALEERHGVRARLVRIGPARFPAVHEAYRAFAREKKLDLMEPGYTSDEDVVAILSKADAFLWPTLAEGFGFPPLEAMACGAPVAALDTPINREICGGVARYHANDADAAADAIAALLRSPPPKDAMLAHARRFTWRRTAEQTLAVYEKVRPR